jgi:hypothetical protein
MIGCVVVANSRPGYLNQVLGSLDRFHPELVPVVVNDDDHVGMAANVQRAWDVFLASDADYLLHMEDDMELVGYLPLRQAALALDEDEFLAQMCFRREPWPGSPLEMQFGDQLAAICAQADDIEVTATHTIHDFLFSLNPSLIPRRIVEMGWPAGPLGVGNEAGMTARLRSAGFRFGSWGRYGDGKVWARHIGHLRGAGWAL